MRPGGDWRRSHGTARGTGATLRRRGESRRKQLLPSAYRHRASPRTYQSNFEVPLHLAVAEFPMISAPPARGRRECGGKRLWEQCGGCPRGRRSINSCRFLDETGWLAPLLHPMDPEPSLAVQRSPASPVGDFYQPSSCPRPSTGRPRGLNVAGIFAEEWAFYPDWRLSCAK